MLSGFRTFIMRGNVVDLAVGVVIGAAFTTVVNSLVKDIITPAIAAIFRQPDFSSWAIKINGSSILVGNFLNNALAFLLVALVIYYFVVIPLNKLFKRAGIKTVIGESLEKKE
jgi:large conductance mechanosensitive channel